LVFCFGKVERQNKGGGEAEMKEVVLDLSELNRMISEVKDVRVKQELLEKYAIALKLLNEIYLKLLRVKEK